MAVAEKTTTPRTPRATAPKTKLAVVGPETEPTPEFSFPNAALSALEFSRSNTFLCDTDFTILYANKKSIEILEFMEPNLRKLDAWKDFRADEIVGANVDFLFTDEPIEFKRASNPRNHPYQKEIKTGPCVCDVQVTSITSDTGELLGYVVDWERITDKIAQEKRVEQLMTVLEHSTSNTLLCDLDWNVLYANNKSFEILEFMEPNLQQWSDAWRSFKAKDIVGKSLEWLFTDAPSEFRKASDPRYHPYHAVIRTGPCTCEVTVTSTQDAQGNATGFAVYWERITDKIAQEKRVEQLMQVLESSSANTLLCDLNWNVLYANKKSFDILEFMEPNLHAHDMKWRSFRGKDIVGKSLEWLFTDEPEEFRRASDTRNHPYRKNIKTGPCTCDVIVTSTRDAKGEVTGYAIYWERITERLKLEEQAQLQIDEGKYLAVKVEEISRVMNSITNDGNLNARIEVEKEDLIGGLSNTINAMTESLIVTARAADQIAAGNLTVQIIPKSDKDMLGNAFQTMLGNLMELVGQTKVAADGIAEASAEVSAGTDDLSQRTEEQASSLEETAASMEEMTATVKQNADNARQANQMASQAREVAERGGSVVAKAVTSMEEINKASKRIADIISVIDEIAFQTNLLALNAAVEAARVGEQGRGFAVVAAEVRSLAGRSATAAKEIKSLVQDSVQKVQEGSTLVNQSGQNLDEIVGSVKRVADIISEISAAGQEQAAGIEQVNKAIMQMDQITQQNAALVEEAAASSQSMTQQAHDLQELVGRFELSPAYLQSLVQKSEAPRAPVYQAPPRRPMAPVRGNVRPSSRYAAPVQSTPTRRSFARPVADDDAFEEF